MDSKNTNKCKYCGAPVEPIIIEKIVAPTNPDAPGFEMDVEMFAMYIRKFYHSGLKAEKDAAPFLEKWKIVKR